MTGIKKPPRVSTKAVVVFCFKFVSAFLIHYFHSDRADPLRGECKYQHFQEQLAYTNNFRYVHALLSRLLDKRGLIHGSYFSFNSLSVNGLPD